MSKFIQLDDINGIKRFVNVRHIALIEPEGVQCRVVMAMPGRESHLNFAFLAIQSFEEVQRLITELKK